MQLINEIINEVFETIKYKDVIKLFEVVEISKTLNEYDFILAITKKHEQINKLLGIDLSIPELACFVTELQFKILAFVSTINKQSDNANSTSGGINDIPPFHRTLCEIKFSISQGMNVSVFEIDNTCFVDVFNNLKQFIKYNKKTSVKYIQATDDDLF